MKEYFIGIDPGIRSGAVAVIVPGRNTAEALDCPDSIHGMAKLMHCIIDNYGDGCMLAAVEKVHSMPRQGVRSTFCFGENFGAWQGIVEAMGLRLLLPPPQEWLKGMLIPKGASKVAHVEMAEKLFPHVELRGPRGGIKDGRADALLIAKYAQKWLWG